MADGKQFVIERRLVYLSIYHGSLTIPCTKCFENVGSGEGVGGGSGGEGVGSVSLTTLLLVLRSLAVCLRRFAITFFLINIFTCGFLQHVRHR